MATKKAKTKKRKDTLMDVFSAVLHNYEVKEKELKGRTYLVVPVTMMVQGVRKGSAGAVLHLASELGKVPESWNGIPVTVGHPFVNGSYVSATEPEIIEDWGVGTVFNAKPSKYSLKSEAWLDKEDLSSYYPDLYQRIEDNEIIEVSIGVYSDAVIKEGKYKGEKYSAIAKNYRPNHLALLPDEVGACSVEDGCGIRVNTKSYTKNALITQENEASILKEITLKGLLNNETGFMDLYEKVQTALNKLEKGGMYFYVVELFNDYVIYNQVTYREDYREQIMLKQSYNENAAGEVEFSGEAVRVKREVNYVTVPNINMKSKRIRTKFNNKKVTVMSKKKKGCSDCVKELVNSLINNKATSWSEKDRSFLEGLNENQLEKMTPVKETGKVKVNTKLSRKDILQVLTESPLTTEEFLKTASPEVRAYVSSALKFQENQKNKMIQSIITNSNGAWEDTDEDKETLGGMPLPTITKMYKATLQANEMEDEIDYTALSANSRLDAEEDALDDEMPIPGVVVNEKEDED